MSCPFQHGSSNYGGWVTKASPVRLGSVVWKDRIYLHGEHDSMYTHTHVLSNRSSLLLYCSSPMCGSMRRRMSPRWRMIGWGPLLHCLAPGSEYISTRAPIFLCDLSVKHVHIYGRGEQARYTLNSDWGLVPNDYIGGMGMSADFCSIALAKHGGFVALWEHGRI